MLAEELLEVLSSLLTVVYRRMSVNYPVRDMIASETYSGASWGRSGG